MKVSKYPGRLLLFACLLSLAGCAGHTHSSTDTGARQCLGLAMYWEARGEGSRGMQAVGSVVLNRVDSGEFPDDVCRVVYQGGETPPCQFSWWCDGKSDRPDDIRQWRQALGMADELLTGKRGDPTRGALFFHSADIAASWHRSRHRTARIGNHVFYR